MPQYVRNILLDIPPYIPGRSIESIQKQFGISKVYKLASNENPLGPSPKAMKAVKQHVKNIHRYPDPNATNLKNKLASKFNLSSPNFLIGNGLAEVIDLIALALIDPGDIVLLGYPTFPKYFLSSTRVSGHVIHVKMKNFHHDYKEILKRVTDKTKIIFIDNPNNPVGSKLSKSEQEEILRLLPDHVVLILDESYRDYIDESECLDYGSVIHKRKNIVFLRSFSKGYGLSGLRVGFAIGHPDIILDINRVREVFNTNSLALVAAEAALDDDRHLKKSRAANEKKKKYLYRHLNRLGYEFQPTFTNFIFVNTFRNLELVDNFLLQHGVIIRPMRLKNFPDEYIRVSIGKSSENWAFIHAMEEMKKSLPEFQ